MYAPLDLQLCLLFFHSVLSSQPINGETFVLSLESILHDLSHKCCALLGRKKHGVPLSSFFHPCFELNYCWDNLDKPLQSNEVFYPNSWFIGCLVLIWWWSAISSFPKWTADQVIFQPSQRCAQASLVGARAWNSYFPIFMTDPFFCLNFRPTSAIVLDTTKRSPILTGAWVALWGFSVTSALSQLSVAKSQIKSPQSFSFNVDKLCGNTSFKVHHFWR